MQIDHPASYAIITRLHEASFQALYAGGCVRDFLLGKTSLDVDIATNATPDQIIALFPKTVAVGAAFGVVLVIWEGEPVEVATFRKDAVYADGRHPERVAWADAQQDAERRDFTVNGMFFDPVHQKLLDFVGGQQDLRDRLLRAIGDPAARFQEDHLRILRGARFAVQIGLQIEANTRSAMIQCAPSLQEGVSVERIIQELQKMQSKGVLAQGLQLMQELGILDVLFPETKGEALPPLPEDLPVVLQLCALHRKSGPLRWMMLPIEWKMSGEERRMTETLAALDEALHQSALDLVDWAHLLARPWADECLEALFTWGGPYPHSFTEVEQMREDLEDAITRIELRSPLVTAADLLQRGLSPGPQLGDFLRAAERIAIEQDCSTKEEVLQQMHLPKGSS